MSDRRIRTEPRSGEVLIHPARRPTHRLWKAFFQPLFGLLSNWKGDLSTLMRNRVWISGSETLFRPFHVFIFYWLLHGNGRGQLKEYAFPFGLCFFEADYEKILGKCKAFWGKPRTLLRLSQTSTELSCTRFDEERSKKIKGDWTSVYVFFREHISPRTSSTVVRVQVVGACEVRTLAGMPGLVIVLDPACACQWERGRTLEKG